MRQYGLYGEDQWRVNERVTLTLGLRADKPDFVDTPAFNQQVFDVLGRSTASTPSDSIVWSPRIGFNWDVTGKGNRSCVAASASSPVARRTSGSPTPMATPASAR